MNDGINDAGTLGYIETGKYIAGSTATGVGRGVKNFVDASANLVATGDGLYKIGKLVDALFLAFQAFGGTCGDVFTNMRNCVTDCIQFIAAQQAVGRWNVFVSGEYREQRSVAKVISVACLVVAKTCETLNWLRKQGLVHLEKSAAFMGRFPVFSTCAKAGLVIMKRVFTLGACVFSIVDAAQQIADAAVHSEKGIARPWLVISYEVCKVACVIFSFTPLVMTAEFAVLAVTTGVLGVSKLLYDQYLVKKPEEKSELIAVRVPAFPTDQKV